MLCHLKKNREINGTEAAFSILPMSFYQDFFVQDTESCWKHKQKNAQDGCAAKENLNCYYPVYLHLFCHRYIYSVLVYIHTVYQKVYLSIITILDKRERVSKEKNMFHLVCGNYILCQAWLMFCWKNMNQLCVQVDCMSKIFKLGFLRKYICNKLCLAFGWRFCNWPLPIATTRNDGRK